MFGISFKPSVCRSASATASAWAELRPAEDIRGASGFCMVIAEDIPVIDSTASESAKSHFADTVSDRGLLLFCKVTSGPLLSPSEMKMSTARSGVDESARPSIDLLQQGP